MAKLSFTWQRGCEEKKIRRFFFPRRPAPLAAHVTAHAAHASALLHTTTQGFAPSNVLPVVLDVGTDTPRLLRDPLYVGIRKPRLRGPAYFEIVDELMGALSRR